MALAEFNSAGDLPEGVHRMTLNELVARFGGETSERKNVTARLMEIQRLARSTGKLARLIVFGSYVTAKPAPRDIDIILIMRDDFDMQACDAPTRTLFEHGPAQQRFGASLFWIRPAMLLNESLDSFIAHWQIKRDGNRRGIVEVIL